MELGRERIEVADSVHRKKPTVRDIDITFRCRFCRKSYPLEDMRVIRRFFPPLVACRECEKRIG